DARHSLLRGTRPDARGVRSAMRGTILVATLAGAERMGPPRREKALLDWLGAGTYRASYTAEPDVHVSTAGAHGQNVRTYYSLILVEDLRTGRTVFRKGATMVKELYFGGARAGDRLRAPHQGPAPQRRHGAGVALLRDCRRHQSRGVLRPRPPGVHRMSPLRCGLPALGVPPMTALTCRDFIEFLAAYLGGELSPEERATFEAHPAECPDCVR